MFVFDKLLLLFMQEIKKRGLKVAVVGIPKTIDNDIPVCLFCLQIVTKLMAD